MAYRKSRKSTGKVTYGKAFRKKTSSGKHKKVFGKK